MPVAMDEIPGLERGGDTRGGQISRCAFHRAPAGFDTPNYLRERNLLVK